MYAWVALTNKGSVRVLEKNGFVRVEPQPPPNQHDVPEQLMVLGRLSVRPADSAGPERFE